MTPRFLDRYRHLIPSALLGGGFFVDILTFRTLRPEATFAVLGAYAFAAAAGVVFGDRVPGRLREAASMVVQFSFGALLSSAFLFYWFGGSVAASWPVMIIVVALMASNEAFRAAFLRPSMQFGVFAFVIFSYCTLLFPFLLRSVSAQVFLFGGAVATCVSLLVAEVSARMDTARRPLLGRFRGIAGGIFTAFVVLYALNVIPPIPLSIRDAGVYHDVKAGAAYVLQGEPENIFQKLWPGQTIRMEHDGDGRIYVYTAIFAPADLSTTIVHRWRRYDDRLGQWADAGISSYTTRGGREEGYRGYSYRTIVAPGRWSVIVETSQGQELGRISFRVKE
jgi:hypothetical protein